MRNLVAGAGEVKWYVSEGAGSIVSAATKRLLKRLVAAKNKAFIHPKL